MARIRTIKPEIWEHPCIAGGSDLAVRLWIFLISQADDEGRGRWDERRMFAKALPGLIWDEDGDRFRAAVREIDGWADNRGKLIAFYDYAGSDYFALGGWHRNQVINKRSPSNIPAPDDKAWGFKPETDPPWWAMESWSLTKHPPSRLVLSRNMAIVGKTGNLDELPPSVRKAFEDRPEETYNSLMAGGMMFEKSTDGTLWTS